MIHFGIGSAQIVREPEPVKTESSPVLIDVKRGDEPMPDIRARRRQILEASLEKLWQDYEAATNQRNMTLDAVEENRLRRKAEDIWKDIEVQNSELESLELAPADESVAVPRCLEEKPVASEQEPRLQAVDLLNKLLPSQFQEVAFRYQVPPQYLPQNVAQNQQAIVVIQYALQKEGERLSQLLNTIGQVAPHLRHG